MSMLGFCLESPHKNFDVKFNQHVHCSKRVQDASLSLDFAVSLQQVGRCGCLSRPGAAKIVLLSMPDSQGT